MSKTSKMKLLSVSNLKPVLKLLSWKGPNGEMEKEGLDEEAKVKQ